MSNKDSMDFKLFFEKINSLLENSTTNELKNIIKSLAEDLAPVERKDFVEKVTCYKTKQIKNPNAPELILEIADLKKEIEEMAQNSGNDYDDEYDYDRYHDEDCLGPFQDFIQLLAQLYDKTATVFDYGNIKIACQAYEELFSIFQIEDDRGRGIRYYDLENVDVNGARARYLRSIYLTAEPKNPKNRARILMEKMDLNSSIGDTKSSLKEIIAVSTEPLPDFQEFINDWVSLASSKEGVQFDAWLREGVKLSAGIAGLEKLARMEGLKRPRAYYDWITALVAENKCMKVITVAEYALSQLPQKLPIRAAIADYLTQAAISINDEKIAAQGRRLSFSAKPTIDKLLGLYKTTEEISRKHLLQDAAQIVKEHLEQKYDDHHSWEQDEIEYQSYVNQSLLLHVYLLANDIKNAFALAQTGETLGWSSSSNPQPFFVAYTFVSCNKSSDTLPPFLQRFWDSALRSSLYEGWGSKIQETVVEKLVNIYGQLQNNKDIHEHLSWCINVAEQRINDIVKNGHRKAYEKAAALTVVCTEVFGLIGETKKAVNLYTKIQKAFPRHSSFQKELKNIFGTKIA